MLCIGCGKKYPEQPEPAKKLKTRVAHERPAAQLLSKIKPLSVPGNHINGTWLLWNFKAKASERENSILRKVLNHSDLLLTWSVTPAPGQSKRGTTKSTGILELTSFNDDGIKDCTAKIQYDMSYCCPDMRVIYLDQGKQPVALGESPAGCVQSKLNLTYAQFFDSLNAEMLPDWHFTYQKDFIELEGPYVDSSATMDLYPI